MQEYFPNGGRDYDDVVALFEAIYAGKIPGVQVTQLNPARGEMIEYLKQAIGEGYQPEHEAAVSELSVIDALSDGDLNREFGKCWQWYNMGGGFHETFEAPKRKSFEQAVEPAIKWLCENSNPHAVITVDVAGATLMTAELSHATDKFIKD